MCCSGIVRSLICNLLTRGAIVIALADIQRDFDPTESHALVYKSLLCAN